MITLVHEKIATLNKYESKNSYYLSVASLKCKIYLVVTFLMLQKGNFETHFNLLFQEDDN